jgi:hypothetical protein
MKQLQVYDDNSDPIFTEYDYQFGKEDSFPSEILQNSMNLLCSLGLVVVPLVVPVSKFPIMAVSFLFYRIKGQRKDTVLLSGIFFEKIINEDSGKNDFKFNYRSILLASCVTVAVSAVIYGILYSEKRILVKSKFLLPHFRYTLTPLLLSQQFPDFLKYVENCKVLPAASLEIPSLVGFLSDSQKMLAGDLFFKLQFNHLYFRQNSKWIFNQMYLNNTFFSDCILEQFKSEVMLRMAIRKSPVLGLFLATLP